MLGDQKLKSFRELVSTTNRDEQIWMSGFLAALTYFPNTLETAPPVESEKIPIPQTVEEEKKQITTIESIEHKQIKITLAYGTETGNTKKLATDFAGKAKKNGIQVKLIGLDQYKTTDLPKEVYFFVIISTQGDGEPPASSLKFYNHLKTGGFSLSQMQYSVLALGDTSYPLFCQAGEDIDQFLEKLNAKRIIPLQKCDVDYETVAQDWFDKVLYFLANPSVELPKEQVSVATVVKTAKKDYVGTIIKNINLNDKGSNKATHHIEISSEELDYLPGDSLGLIPHNNHAMVRAVLAFASTQPEREVIYKGNMVRVGELISQKLNIVYLPERVVTKYAEIVGKTVQSKRLDLLDLLKVYPVKNAQQFEEVINILDPIAPRLYSISSSLSANEGEVHITVAKNTFRVNGTTRSGLASGYLTQLPLNSNFHFYIHRNNLFRLPPPEKDIIMIGPGTGIAPFRAFLSERNATGASGKNWLFFGEQHFTTDFLYQTEIQDWYNTGLLTKVCLAFSRDQPEKIYVQHRMEEEGETFFQWLINGAYIYVCGTKDPMSVDVENALLQIIRKHGQLSVRAAEQYIGQLKESGRYLKDVY